MTSTYASFIASSVYLSELLEMRREKLQQPDFQQGWSCDEEGSTAGLGEA